MNENPTWPGEEPLKTEDVKIDPNVEIARLAALSAINYEQQRQASAKLLEMRVGVLDQLVAAARPPSSETTGQGTPLNIAEILPWPDPVQGEALVDDVVKAIRSHVILTEDQALAVTLWCLHTHAFESADISARLNLYSPEPRCGKTTTLDMIKEFVPKAISTENITMAAMFRTIEMVRPTLLIDEADAFLKDNEDLRGMLNAGHRKGGQVIRTVGDNFEPRAFSVWAPVVIAGIGRLSPSLVDRSITVSLRRRLKTEPVNRLGRDRTHLSVLGRRMARWVADNIDVIKTDPKLPEELNDRAQDNWRQLIAIADAISIAVGERAGTAAKNIAEEKIDEENHDGIVALADVAEVFEASKKKRISSQELLTTLLNMEDRPWGRWKRQDEGLTKDQLARFLRPFGIRPKKIRFDTGLLQGYLVEQVTEAKLRYVDDVDDREEEIDGTTTGSGTATKDRP
jgi:putative DNA primase/helicase